MVSSGFPMVFPSFSYGFPRVFLGFTTNTVAEIFVVGRRATGCRGWRWKKGCWSRRPNCHGWRPPPSAFVVTNANPRKTVGNYRKRWEKVCFSWDFQLVFCGYPRFFWLVKISWKSQIYKWMITRATLHDRKPPSRKMCSMGPRRYGKVGL